MKCKYVKSETELIEGYIYIDDKVLNFFTPDHKLYLNMDHPKIRLHRDSIKATGYKYLRTNKRGRKLYECAEEYFIIILAKK